MVGIDIVLYFRNVAIDKKNDAAKDAAAKIDAVVE